MAKHDKKEGKMSTQASYDQENDILFLHKGFNADEKFKGNIDIGCLVLDISTKGRVKGIEIINASKFFKELQIAKETLAAMQGADFTAHVGKDNIAITLLIRSGEKEIPARIAVPLEAAKA